MYEGPFFLYPYQHLLFVFLMTDILTGMGWNPSVVLICKIPLYPGMVNISSYSYYYPLLHIPISSYYYPLLHIPIS
jgi:hypothetical protein